MNQTRTGRLESVPAIQMPVQTADGTENSLTIFTAAPGPSAPVVVCWPAMGVSARYYETLAAALAGNGLIAVTADLRGVGRSSVRASSSTNFGYADMISQDMPAVLDAVAAKFPRAPVYFLGHSLGGQLSALFLAANPDDTRVAGLILVAASSVYYKGWDFPRWIWIWLGIRLVRGITGILGYFPGHRMGFGGQEAKGVIRDWYHLGVTGKYDIAGQNQPLEEMLGRVDRPVLAITLENDPMAPEKAAGFLTDKLKSAPKTRVHLKTEAFDAEKVTHFSWAKHPGPVVREIGRWMAGLGINPSDRRSAPKAP